MEKPILLVEDDVGIQDLVRMTLEDEGYAVLVAGDGDDALEILKNTTPALILLDYMMPRMNGAQFIQEAVKQDLRDAIPLVLLTAANYAPSRAQEIGTDAYVGKPFDIAHLLLTIEHFINP
jgi:DNA-binding response OmpR family regulator